MEDEQKATHDYTKQVDYETADPVKIFAQTQAQATAGNLGGHGFTEVTGSRGESAYVVDIGDRYIALTQEGLGTKSLVTKAVYEQTGESFFAETAIDTVSTIVNDLITVGALPFAVNAYWSSNSYGWMKDNQVAEDLISGWKEACDMSGATWGGGETQALSSVIHDGVLELAGSGMGIIDPKSRLTLGEKLQDGDQIIFCESSGIQTNGISLAREIANGLPESYQTELASGKTFGQALLAPSVIYAPLVRSLFDEGIDIHYMSHITGHGWRKIMRANANFTYKITFVPPVPEVLAFIAKQASMDDKVAYATFNMGAGFALFVASEDVGTVLDHAHATGIKAWHSGAVMAGERAVEIPTLGLRYESASLDIRAK